MAKELPRPPPPPLLADEIEAALVDGDRLQRDGDPRGELIVVQARLAQAPTDELRDHERQLFARHVAAWLGGSLPSRGVEVTWRLGWIDSIAIDLLPLTTIGPLLRRLLTMPAGRRIRALHAQAYPRHRGPFHRNDGEVFGEIVEALVDVRPPLRELICDFTCDPEWDLGDPGFSMGELGQLWTVLPLLEHVGLQSLDMSLELGDEVPYRYFAGLGPHGMTTDDLAAIASATWPALETLVLGCGATRLAELQPVLAGHRMPALKHLELREVRNEILDRFVEHAPLLHQLETLALSSLRYNDEPVPTLDPSDRAFSHLRTFEYQAS